MFRQLISSGTMPGSYSYFVRCLHFSKVVQARSKLGPVGKHKQIPSTPKKYRKTLNKVSMQGIGDSSSSVRLNSKEILSSLLRESDVIGDKPMAHIKFEYVPEDQEQNVQDLVQQLLTRTIGKSFGDKLVVNGVQFYGMSGAGKTRISMELIGLMREAANKSRHPSKDLLLEKLRKPAILTVDWWSGGYAYKRHIEERWPASLVLGARLAAKFWFKSYDFDRIRTIIAALPEQAQQQFHFEKVARAIIAENEAKPASERYTMLYMANDEFQPLRLIDVPYGGSAKSGNASTALEPLSLAIARVFMTTSRVLLSKLFIFGSFVGIGLHHNYLFPHPTDGAFPDYCMCCLSIKSARAIVKSELGDAWSNVPDLDRLLSTLGGNPRLLEIFCTDVASQMTPAEYDSRKAFDTLIRCVDRRYRIKLANGPFVWPLLLSVAGYSVTARNSPVAWQLKSHTLNEIEIWTAEKAEQSGYISLRGPTNGEKWFPAAGNSSIILDTPMVIAKSVLSISNPQDQQFPNGKELPQNVYWELVHQANKVTTDFFVNGYKFEELIVRQFVFRWNMFNFTSQADYIPAEHLFFGGYCLPAFKELKFVVETKALSVASAHPGEWSKTPSTATDQVLLASKQTVKLTDLTHRGIYFGANNVFDGHLRLFNYDTKQQVIVWLDAKHLAQKSGTGSLSKLEVNNLKDKLAKLAAGLPNFEHLLVVVSNRHCKYSEEDINDKMCIIACDGLSFGTSPWISLVTQIGFDNDRQE